MVAAINEHTNDRIRVGTGSDDSYGSAYDSIFRKYKPEKAPTRNLILTLDSSVVEELISKTLARNVSVDSFIEDIVKKNLKFL